jgi:hypothetical protein
MKFCNHLKYYLLTLTLVGVAGSRILADIIHVPGQEPTIRAAIVQIEEGDTVMVSAGTHYGDGNRDIDFGGKAIVVKSMKGATLTVLNCQGSAADPHRGFLVHQGEDSTTVIEGFTIINGYAPSDGPGDESIGGGILCRDGSSPTIKECILYDNYAAGTGGGLACIENSSPQVINCTFVDNSTIAAGGAYFVGYGGGIRCVSSSPTFYDCIIASNRANVGGGMSCNGSHPVFELCEFSDNIADVHMTFEPAFPGVGGGLHLYNSSAVMDHCVFDRNSAISGQNMDYTSAMGGGIAAINSPVTLTGCTIYGNIAEKYNVGFPGSGAALFLAESPIEVENSIIAYNTGAEAVTCVEPCSDTIPPPAFSCTDIFGNELGDWTDSLAALAKINGNISKAPYFCNPESGNFSLWDYSPCVADSIECGIHIGAFGIGCITDIDEPVGRLETYYLAQNRPNPFNQSTLIEYNLPVASEISIIIYNPLGQVVRRLVRGFTLSGRHAVIWDGKDGNGAEVASGLYVYSIRADQYHEARRMILVK